MGGRWDATMFQRQVAVNSLATRTSVALGSGSGVITVPGECIAGS